MGRLADIYSHRLLFLSGTTLFAAFSIAIALSNNFVAFTSVCTLLALGAAANTPAGTGLIGANFDGESKNRAFAVLGAGQPLGYICGLVIGAIFSQSHAGWRGASSERVCTSEGV